MSQTIHKVAIAGATGSLGSAITNAIVAAGFEVTALTRDAAAAKLPSGVKAVSVDYSSPASIKQALQGQDALVSTISAHGDDPQPALFNAAIEVGVKRLIPSEFGSDDTSSIPRQYPAYKPKVELQDLLKAKTAGSSKSTYTFVQNGAFLDWGLSHGFLVNLKEKKAVLHDGGDVPFTATPHDTVGLGVVGVLKHPEQTANRVVRIHGAKVTLKQLLALGQKHTSQEGWQVSESDTQKNLDQAYVSLKNDPKNVMAWLFPMLIRAAVGRGMDVDWEESNDNKLLGITPLTHAEVEQFVKEAVPKA